MRKGGAPVFWIGLVTGIAVGTALTFLAAIFYGFGWREPQTGHSPPYDSFPGRL